LKSIVDVEQRQETIPGTVVKPALQTGRSSRLWIGATAIACMTSVALGILLWHAYKFQPDSATTRFSIATPDQVSINSPASGPVISPDGKRIAFSGINASGKRMLWIRPLDGLVAQQLPGSEDATAPFWSPDSRSIAFFAINKLKKIDVAGGPPINLSDAASGRGGAWNRDGTIVFSPTSAGSLFRVPAAGGQAVAVTKLMTSQGNHRAPSFLPDGDHFLYFATGISQETQGIYVGSLKTGESKRLFYSDATAIYAPSGQVLFVQNGVLMKKLLDTAKLEVSSDATPVADSVAVDAIYLSAISVSDNGTLVYRSGSAFNESRQLATYDRTGKLIDRIGPVGRYIGMDWSPDGKQLAVHRHDGTGGDIWLFELMRGTMSRLTFDAGQDNSMPIWSADGKRIVFSSLRDGKWGLYQKLSTGTGKEELLYESAGTEKAPMSWSPDDKYIVFEVTDVKTGWDLWMLPLFGDRKAYPLMQTPFNETWAEISPNGKWIAYDSDETGRYEVYIRPFPSGDGKWQVSTNGGWYPRWQKDGKELFYLDAAANGKILSVRVNISGQAPEFSSAAPLFDSGYININHGVHHKYAVSPDGKHFIIPRAEATLTGDTRQLPITVVLNWDSEFKKK
jgi:Tol biopolymer transport system component